MNKPILIVMAAGLSSRYGGLKQTAPVDDAGHILIDYSLYDARRAGFERVIFIVAEALEKDFREAIGDRIAKRMDVRYAHQKLEMLPDGFHVPDGRVKPWGTAHAVLCAKDMTDANFAVINADDFYGDSAFRSIYDFISLEADDRHHAMAGYFIGNTVSGHGHVARGVCKTEGGALLEITERTHVEARAGGAAYTEDGVTFTFLPDDTVVSMNLLGFGSSIMDEIDAQFPVFLAENLLKNPQKCEYYLPLVLNRLLKEGKVEVTVLPTHNKWYGVTYADDMPVVRNALAKMRAAGVYPDAMN